MLSCTKHKRKKESVYLSLPIQELCCHVPGLNKKTSVYVSLSAIFISDKSMNRWWPGLTFFHLVIFRFPTTQPILMSRKVCGNSACESVKHLSIFAIQNKTGLTVGAVGTLCT